MKTADIIEQLADVEDGQLLKANGFDEALVGVVAGWFDNSQHSVICYDFEKCVEILMERDGMEAEDAIEFLEVNTIGAYIGPYTPVFLHNWRKAPRDD